MPVITCPDCGRDVSTLASACPHCGRPSPAGMAPIGASPALPVNEETLWRGSPSSKVLIGKVAMIIVAVIVIPLIAHVVDSTGQLEKFGWWITAAVVLFLIITLIVALVRQRSTLYTITNQRVMIEQGILSKSLNEIDLRTIDDSQFFQRFIERLLGIGSVTLIASDKSQPTTVLRAIDDPRKVRELIRTHAYRVSQRQVFTRAT